MRRSVLLLTCLLSLATGLVLLRTADSLTAPALRVAPAPDRRAEDVALVRRFYAAANAILAGGDAASLDRIVAVDLVEHPAPPGGGGRVGLAARLRALGAAERGLQLAVDGVEATGADEVTARIHATGAAPGAVLRPPTLGEAAAWGPLEVFRVAGGRIVERWSDGAAPTVLRSLAATSLAFDAGENGPRLVALTRLDLAPGATGTVGTGGATRLLVVESGAVRVRRLDARGGAATSQRADGPTTVPPDDAVRHDVGDAIVVSPGSRLVATAAGDTPAAVLIATVFGREWGRDAAAAWTDAAALARSGDAGVRAEVLAAGALVVPNGAVFAASRVTVAPGADFVAGGEGATLIAVDTGESAPTAAAGPASATLDRAAAPSATPAGGSGLLVPPGLAVTWHPPDGTALTATVFTVQPAALATPTA